MLIKVADFCFRFSNYTGATYVVCKDFIVRDKSEINGLDLDIVVTEEDIKYELSVAEKYGEKVSPENCENLAIYRKICAYVLQHDAFLMHGAVIEYEGKGYAFTATSGTGKTTHIMQWKKAFGEDNVTIINGDKPIIRFIDDKVYAYGTPWNGKEHYGTTGKTELHGLCFLKRGEENKIRRITSEEAIPMLFSQIMITDSADLAKQLELADRLVEKVPMYVLECNISEEAARVSYEGMQ